MKELLKNKWAWAVLILVVLNIASIGFMWCSMCCKTEKTGCQRSEMCHSGAHGHAHEKGCCTYKCGHDGQSGGEKCGENHSTHSEGGRKSCCSEHGDSIKGR